MLNKYVGLIIFMHPDLLTMKWIRRDADPQSCLAHPPRLFRLLLESYTILYLVYSVHLRASNKCRNSVNVWQSDSWEYLQLVFYSKPKALGMSINAPSCDANP